jgi:hypothetical protein
MERTPDFLGYMLSACTWRVKAAVAASRAVVRTIVDSGRQTVYSWRVLKRERRLRHSGAYETRLT